MRTVTLEDGKYEFDLDSRGLMVAARRHGEPWPAGFDMRFTKAFMAALWKVQELETEVHHQNDLDEARFEWLRNHETYMDDIHARMNRDDAMTVRQAIDELMSGK